MIVKANRATDVGNVLMVSTPTTVFAKRVILEKTAKQVCAVFEFNT